MNKGSILVQDARESNLPLYVDDLSYSVYRNNIVTDDNGEYTFLSIDYSKAIPQEFFDGDEKVASVEIIDGDININIYTNKQVNIFSDISANSCCIESFGPVCIDGKIDTQSSFNLSAESVCLLDTVNSKGDIELNLRGSFDIRASVTANNLSMHADIINLCANIDVEAMCDVTSHAFTQENTGKLVSSELRLVSDQCLLSGEMLIKDNSFVVSQSLQIGSESGQTVINLPGENYLHAGNCEIVGDTQFNMKRHNPEVISDFLVDAILSISEHSLVDLDGCELDCHTLTHHGKLIEKDTLNNIDFLEQNGDLDLAHSDMTVFECFRQYGTAKTKMNNTLASGGQWVVHGGDLRLDSTNLEAQSVKMFDGLFSAANNSEIKLADSFEVFKQAELQCSNSEFYSDYRFNLNGKSSVIDCKIQCYSFNAYEAPLQSESTSVKAEKNITLSQGATLKKVNLVADDIYIKKTILLDDIDVRARKLYFECEEGSINKCTSSSEILKIQGGPLSDTLSFTQSHMVSHLIMQKNHVKMDKSLLIGISSDCLSHRIDGNLQLINSRYITQNQVHHMPGSVVELSGFSSLQTGAIWNEGCISSDKSSIFTGALLQNKATLSLNGGVAKIKERLCSNNTKVTLCERAKVLSKKMRHAGQLKLKEKSTLSVANDLIMNNKSELACDNSLLSARKYLSLGRAEMSQSLLSTNDLVIYNKFKINDKSKVHAKNTVSTAKESQVTIKNSVVYSREINSFGKVVSEDAELKAQEKINVWSTANTNLGGSTSLVAQSMWLDGNWNVVSQNNKAPTLCAKERIAITSDASITGDDLNVLAEIIDQLGSIDLKGDFRAKGETFTNEGSVNAKKSIFLGFDDAVLNMGMMQSNNIIIHSNFFNILGGVSAEKSFSSSGFVSSNLGFILANNYSNDSLISLNGGLYLPNFSADPNIFFSESNLTNFVRSAAITMFPSIASAVNTAFMFPSLIKTTASLCNTFKQYDWDGLKSLRRHEIMPLFCQVKSAALLSSNAVSTLQSSIAEVQKIDVESLQTKPFDINTTKLATHCIDILGGNYIDNSLLHLNLGATLATNTTKSSIVHGNAGVEYSLFGHRINTHTLYNSGYSGGGESNFVANDIINDGNMVGVNRFTMTAKNMQNGAAGSVTGSGAMVDIDSLSQHGKMALADGVVKVNTFLDDSTASTQLTQIHATGTSMNISGNLQASEVLFDYTEHFHSMSDALMFFDTVQVKTKDYQHQGKLDYQNTVAISADCVSHAKGSIIKGALTADSDEFKPKHILSISTKKLQLAGQQSGGDYTQIQGNASDDAPSKVESLIIAESAELDLHHGEIKAQDAEMSGKVTLHEIQLDIDHNHIAKEADYSWSKVNYLGGALKSEGVLHVEQSYANLKELEFTESGQETLIDSHFVTDTLKDASHLTYQGEVFFKTNHYDHTGHIQKMNQPEGSAHENLFFVTANNASLKGSADIDHGYFDFAHFSDSVNFVSGRGDYQQYAVSGQLDYSTLDSFHSNQKVYRDCDLSVTASDIVFDTVYDNKYHLAFISTQGDISLSDGVHSQSLYLNSSANIHTNKLIYTEGLIQFEAKGSYNNWGGTLNGDVVSIKSANIRNITAASVLGQANTYYPVSDSGVINARSKGFLEATEGNVENHGGIIRAGDYLQVLAANDILNLCNERAYQGKHDIIKEFDPGLISGGNGQSSDGLGLYIRAGGKVISDASQFVSLGDNYIEGVKGVEFQERHHTYVSKDKKKKKYFGFSKKHVIETTTTVQGSLVHSDYGRNIICSSESEVSSVAGQFSGAGGTDIYAKGDVKLFSLKTQDRKHTSRSSFWGLNKSKRKEIYESATPVLFVDNGLTRIHSEQGNVDARGAYFIGDGDLMIKSAKKIFLGADILTHSIHEKSQSIGISLPGQGAWNAYKQGGHIWNMVTAEDATLAKIHSLSQSQNAAETCANAANLGIDFYNTTNSAMRGIANGAIGDELLSRYGFSSTLSMTKQESKLSFQTRAQGGVDRGGNVVLDAREEVDIHGKVSAGKDMEINAPKATLHADELHCSYKQKTEVVHVGVTPTGQINDVGYSNSTINSTETKYLNAEVSAGGNLKIHNNGAAMTQLELDGGNIKANTMDAGIEHLIARDKQDFSEIENKSFSASTSGQVSAYEGHGCSKATTMHSGIFVKEGINTDGHVVKVGTAFMEGGVIETDGVNKFSAEKLVSSTLKDEKHYSGSGVGFNLNDISRLTSDQTPSNVSGEKAIPTAVVTIDYQHFESQQKPVIYGNMGTQLDVKELIGQVHTESRDGEYVKSDKTYHMNIDIPLTNAANLKESQRNIQSGMITLKEVLSQAQKSEQVSSANNLSLPQLKFDETADQDLQTLLVQATEEIKETGVLSEIMQRELSERVTDVLLQGIKAGGEASWAVLMNQLGPEYEASIISLLSRPDTFEHGAVKAYLGGKGLLLTFTFNLISSWQKGAEDDLLLDALANTGGDIVFGVSLEYLAGSLSGPIGWTLLSANMVDTLVYDQNFVNKLFDDGQQGIQDAQALGDMGDYFCAYGAHQLASEQMAMAREAQATHQILQIPSLIGQGIKFLFNYAREPGVSEIETEIPIHLKDGCNMETL